MAEQTNGGSVKRYLRGINLLAGETDGMVYYYILNEHGDVTQLWGQSGTCKALYEYDAFGNERKPEKGDENPFRYCGEYLDLETDTYYLRARSYRAGTGRFTQEDTLWCAKNQLPNGQEIPDPLSLNKYTYCHNNPTRYSDPSGHFIISTTAIVTAVAATAFAAAGAFMGKWLAEKMEVAKEDQWKYVVGGAVGGAVLGATVGYLAGPAIVAATGVGGISVTSGGISLVEAGTVGGAGATGFEQARQLLEAQKLNASGSFEDFFLDAGNGKGILATIDANGVVEFAIEAGKGSSIPGREMFAQMMNHFGSNVNAVRGNWSYGDNLGMVNRLTSAGVPLEEAVLKTWTAGQSALYGFTNAAIQTIKGIPGAYTKLGVLFTR